MKAFLSHRIRNGVLYVRVLGRLGMRHFLGWFFLHGFCDASIEACLCLHRLQRPISITLLKVKGSPLENTHGAQIGTVWGGTSA